MSNTSVKLSELASLSINKVIETLSNSYTKLIEKGISLDGSVCCQPILILWECS